MDIPRLHLYRCKMIIALIYDGVNLKSTQIGAKRLVMNKTVETKIGNNIRRIREGRQMTQDALAARLQLCGCDITRSAVAKIEVGQRHLYPDEIILLRKILNTSYEELLDV